MQEKESNVHSSMRPWWSIADAAKQNQENRRRFSAKQLAAADTFADCLKLAYAGNTYINYRAKFIAIKIERPITKDRFYKEMIEATCREKGFEKVRTKQGIIYRMPKA